MALRIDRDVNITVLTLDRPEVRNALDGETIAELGEALLAAEVDSAVGAVILTGSGDRAFCAGMDLRAFAAGNIAVDSTRPGLEVLGNGTFSKPIIAAANGSAVGGGFELMLRCDLIVAATHARFGTPEVARGLVPAGGATDLASWLPPALAMELLLTGSLIDAECAWRWGLINRIVDGPSVLPTAMTLATTIAANGPLALRVTKQLALRARGQTAVQEIQNAAKPVFDSDDAREGAIAFAEKRTPRWSGR